MNPEQRRSATATQVARRLSNRSTAWFLELTLILPTCALVSPEIAMGAIVGRVLRFNANYGISPEGRAHNHFRRRWSLLINKCPPVRNRAEGHDCSTASSLRSESRYCLSYTEVLLNFLPCGSVPLAETVRVLPSAETTARPLIVTFSPFLIVNPNV